MADFENVQSDTEAHDVVQLTEASSVNDTLKSNISRTETHVGIAIDLVEFKYENHEITLRWQDHKQEFIEWADSQDNLDIYQLAAFHYKTKPLNGWLKTVLKMVICQCLQMLSLRYLFDFEVEGDLCRAQSGTLSAANASDSSKLKTLAILFTLFLSSSLVDQIAGIGSFGLYRFGKKQPPFVERRFITLGMVTNVIVMFWALLISTIVIYNSTDALDLILNSVAVYFISELDNEMVYPHDYYKIQQFFFEHYEDFMTEYIEEIYPKEVAKREKCKNNWCVKIYCAWINSFYWIVEKFSHSPSFTWWCMMPLMMLSPIYIFMCY